MIERVLSRSDANICDDLLTMLYHDERINYDSSLDPNFVVKDYFKNVIMDDRNIVLAYKENNIIVGYIFLKYINDDNYLLDGLFVLEDYRNKSIGRKLLEHSISLLKSMNIKNIDIHVKKENKIAYNLYTSLGFIDNGDYLRIEN